jgi:hypothetical protein
VVSFVRAGTLDAELMATLWVLIEGRIPLVVAAQAHATGKTTLLDALLDFLPPGVRVRDLAGAFETFDWLPQATELGWSRPGASGLAGPPRADARNQASPDSPRHGHPNPDGTTDGTPDRSPPIRADTTVIHAAELSDHTPAYTWGAEARLAIRTTTVGYQLVTTLHADTLEDVFATLREPPVRAGEDELTRLGLVVILRRLADGRRRVAAVHYVRPIARDEHGHVQRLGPAVLATWDPAVDRFEHFAWGVTPELAARIGWRSGDLEREIDRRRDYLDGLAQAGIVEIDAVRTAIAGYRAQRAAATDGVTGGQA